MKFEWDENKNKKNIKKHGIDFNDAKEVFKDEKRVVSKDDRKDYGELRWLAVGAIIGSILAVVFTIRDTAIRIISARRANKDEKDEYYNQ
ncbi:MAG: BrnT family toxin [Saprospirales bacterium]|nr:BrnT family toxin [Saprospirales bacterium]